MKKNNMLDDVNAQIEMALNIERVRLAEKFISEKQINFEMQYALELLQQALLGFADLRIQPQKDRNLLESSSTWIDV